MNARPPLDRRALRARRLAIRRRRVGVGLGALAAVAVVVLTASIVEGAQPDAAPSAAPSAEAVVAVGPTPASSLPVPVLVGAPAASGDRAPASACGSAPVADALGSGDDGAVIRAFGGAEPFRAAVAGGAAPCIDLADPEHLWVVVNKRRPYVPIDWAPSSITLPKDVRNLAGGGLRPDAATAMTELAAASQRAGAGEIALASAYRSYRTQRSSYASQESDEGTTQAELSVARPGFSEHQSGLTMDVVACARECGGLDDLAGTAQGAWIVAHAAEHGWIVRYEAGYTGITGYLPEPWHLRYVGTDLALAYRDGGFRTLEEFFGLPAAPDYG